MAAKEKETKVIKTAALKLGALDKTLFAARGGLKRRKKKLQKLEKQFEIIFKATHELRPSPLSTTHAPHDLRFMRHLTRVAAQVESLSLSQSVSPSQSPESAGCTSLKFLN